ncbi:MAG: exosortase/archaeosortase family protein [Desulfuromonadales bacterium]|nr:exosortase/archaeosortase family protein [Desulfuromonadales bacterium]
MAIARDYKKIIWVGGPLAIASGFILVYWPVLSGLWNTWMHSEDYSHGFLVVPVCLYIAFKKKERLLELLATDTKWVPGVVLVGFSLVLHVFSFWAGVFTLSALSLILTVTGLVLVFLGPQGGRTLCLPLSLLFFMVPFPAQIYTLLTHPLQLIVTKGAVFLASQTGIPLFREGNIIHLPEQTLQVVQACSGMRSILSLLFLAAIFGYFTLQKNSLRWILFMLGLPIAVAVNTLRIFGIILASYWFRIDLLTGVWHTFYGMVLFILSLGLLCLAQRLVSLWPVPSS